MDKGYIWGFPYGLDNIWVTLTWSDSELCWQWIVSACRATDRSKATPKNSNIFVISWGRFLNRSFSVNRGNSNSLITQKFFSDEHNFFTVSWVEFDLYDTKFHLYGWPLSNRKLFYFHERILF